MRQLKNKWNSQRGASMLLALLFLLICTTVSASILIATMSNAGKRNSNREEQQAYLALSSVVQVLCDELSGAEYKGRYIYHQKDDGSIEKKQEFGVYTGKFASLLLSDMDSIFAGTLKEKDNEFTVEEFEKPLVKHNITVQPNTTTQLDDYEITIHLTVKNSYAMDIWATLEDYTMHVEMTPNSTLPTLPEELKSGNTAQYTDGLTWKVGWITTGEEEE